MDQAGFGKPPYTSMQQFTGSCWSTSAFRVVYQGGTALLNNGRIFFACGAVAPDNTQTFLAGQFNGFHKTGDTNATTGQGLSMLLLTLPSGGGAQGRVVGSIGPSFQD